MSANSTVDLDLEVDGDLELMEWDHLIDDSLGTVSFAELTPEHPTCLVESKAEGSLYRLYFSFT